MQPAVKEPESHLCADTPAAADLGLLVRAAEAMEKAFGAESPEARAVQHKLLEARSDRDCTKPLRTQILTAERKIAKKKKSADAARQHCKDMEASVAAARRKAEEARRAQDTLQEELQSMETELRDLQLRVVSGGASQEPPPSATDEAVRAGLQWPLLPQAVRDLPEVQTVLAEAAGAIRRIAATAEFDASGRSEWAEADDNSDMEFDGVGRPAAETVYLDMRSPVGRAAALSPMGGATPVAFEGPPVGGTATPAEGLAPSTPPGHVQGHRGGYPNVSPLPGGVSGRHGTFPFASWRRDRNSVPRSRTRSPEPQQPRQRTMDDYVVQPGPRG